MSPGGHLVTTAATCAVVYAGTGSPALTAGLAAGGFLIDVDHVVDYVLFERQRDLRPGSFLRYYVNGRVQRVRVRIEKPDVARSFKSVGIEIERCQTLRPGGGRG